MPNLATTGESTNVGDQRQLLVHFLAALAYRTQKALRGAGADFGTFRAAEGAYGLRRK